MDITYLLAFANIATGLVAILSAAAAALWASRERRTAEKASDRAMFEDAIRSDDLSKMGKYLEDVIGGLTVGEYVKDREVKRRIDEYLDHITDFLNRDIVGTESTIPAAGERPHEELSKRWTVEAAYLSDQVGKDIDRGEVWNGLARLRRTIEQVLTELAMERKIDIGKRRGAAFLIQRLRQAEAIDTQTAQELTRVVGIANRAIHGDEVTTEEAQRTVSMAMSALFRLGVESPV